MLPLINMQILLGLTHRGTHYLIIIVQRYFVKFPEDGSQVSQLKESFSHGAGRHLFRLLSGLL